MKATIKQADPKPTTCFDVECAGEIIGRAEVNNVGRFHVVIQGSPETGVATLYQGLGASLEIAIHNLLDKHEKQAQAQLHQIQQLREILI